MKKLFKIYAVIAVSFFTYIAIILSLATMKDKVPSTFDIIQVFFITFGLPTMILVWFPMRIICTYNRRKESKNNDKNNDTNNDKNKDNLDTILK